MGDNPKIIFTITSGFPQYVREVDIYDSTLAHIRENHPLEYEKLAEIISTMEGRATHIFGSRTSNTAVVFVNQDVVHPTTGDPMRVPVKVFVDGTGIMSTAYYAAASTHGETLWSKEGGTVKPTFAGKRTRTGRDDER